MRQHEACGAASPCRIPVLKAGPTQSGSPSRDGDCRRRRAQGLGLGAAGEFDLAWSLESGEHMPDKQKFVGEVVRVTAPGGRVLIVTWCHRVLLPGEAALHPREQALLDRHACPSCPAPAPVPQRHRLGVNNVTPCHPALQVRCRLQQVACKLCQSRNRHQTVPVNLQLEKNLFGLLC